MTVARTRAGQLGACGLLVWAGLSTGVAFLATPAKFLAPSLTLPVALDVGRQTFAVYNRVEIGLAAVLAVVALVSGRGLLIGCVFAAAAIVLVERIWLLPPLDARVAEIIAGQGNLPRSSLHSWYIGVEAVKAGFLLAFGGILAMQGKV